MTRRRRQCPTAAAAAAALALLTCHSGCTAFAPPSTTLGGLHRAGAGGPHSCTRPATHTRALGGGVARQPPRPARTALRSETSAINIDTISAELLAISATAQAEMEAATTLKELEELRRVYLTKKGPVQKVMGQMRLLSAEDKPKLGKVSNEVKDALETKLADRKAALEADEVNARLAGEALDVTLPGIPFAPHGLGHRHPISIMQELATDIFLDMGYDLVDGTIAAPEIENDYYCFEALNCPPHHPARDMQDTFYVSQPDSGYDPLLLRTHTSAVQIRALEARGAPLAIVAPGRVYRRDTPDATHAPEFHQVEILHLREKGELTMEHLKGTVETFLKKMFGPQVKTRFRGSFFPFTEPSMEVDIWFKNRWMEVLGCGMVDPRVLEMAGVDPERYSGFAAGFGVERFTMVLFGVPDLRMFWDSDLRFVEQWPSDVQSLKDAIRAGSLGDAVADD